MRKFLFLLFVLSLSCLLLIGCEQSAVEPIVPSDPNVPVIEPEAAPEVEPVAATEVVIELEPEGAPEGGDSGSSEASTDDATPAWLQTIIDDLPAKPITGVPIVVSRWGYQGETVYYVPITVPDGMSSLYAADGSLICRPDGGFTGKGDGNCTDFFDSRTDEFVVWRGGK